MITRVTKAILRTCLGNGRVKSGEVCGGDSRDGSGKTEAGMVTRLFALILTAFILFSGNARAASIPIESSTAAVGNGIYSSSNNGLIPDTGTQFYGFSQSSITGNRNGITYVRFSSLGLGSAIQGGTYTLVMRLASNGMQNWPGAKNMTTNNSGSGYASGFFNTVGSGFPTPSEDGNATLNNMVGFNNTAGVVYVGDTSVLAAPNPLPLSDTGMAEDRWYSVTSKWVIAVGSPVIGTDPYVGLGFQVGNSNSGSVWVDDSVLTLDLPAMTAALSLFIVN